MARVTVEDCTQIIPNRFELVVLSSRRARDIASGSEIKVERDNDKDAVISLREIADNHVAKDYLVEEVVSAHQSNAIYKAEEKEIDVEARAALQEEAGDQDLPAADAKAEMFAEDNIEVDD